MTPERAAPTLDGLTVQTVGAARTLTLDRPERRNALTPDVARALAGQVDAAGREDAVRVVLLRGSGGHFCVGLDLKWYLELGDAIAGQDLERGLRAFQDVVRAIVRSPLPVVGVLEGSVAGIGLDIALACDLRIASDTLAVSSAFAMMGLVPDGGSTYTLPRLLGSGNALDILLAGTTADAARAREIGLVSAVYPDDRLEQEAAALAERLAAAAGSSVRRIKALARGDELNALEGHLEQEGRAQLEALASDEFRERLARFTARPR